MNLSNREFETLVEDGLALIPAEIRAFMDNVQIIVEETPSRKLLKQLHVPAGDALFGLYEGVPLSERSSSYSAFPDRIIIFRRPLIDEFHNPHELRREIARTVIHEVAHHFGIDEDRLAELGWD
jgi:predicted Zn-dependent protease with MMP-like domain